MTYVKPLPAERMTKALFEGGYHGESLTGRVENEMVQRGNRGGVRIRNWLFEQ